MSNAHDAISAFAEKHGLTITGEFIPFSKSRNKGEKSPSLNWKVTVHKNGLPVITTDYMKGCAHCPAYHQPVLFSTGKRDKYETGLLIARECETGFAGFSHKAIRPGLVGVLSSLALDAGAIDFACFEDFAREFGYDADSRKCESVYRACLETALRLRASIGETALTELRGLANEL